jgi:SARP family transcriptional regulator, regulator of embCAB operon
MRLRLLGPLELRDARGNPVAVSGQKRRALLATLAVRAGRPVAIDRLIHELWGNTPPANAGNALQAHIVRLRKAMGADRLVTQPPGYTLLLPDNDIVEFRATVAAARTSPAPIPLLRQALALWRGPALAGCVLGDICAEEASALEETRLAALESLYDASLRAGQHREVVAELTGATVTYPLRERFYEQLIVALCRSGRNRDAAGVYDRARRSLRVELGVEPGPTLRARAREIA